MEIMLSPIPRIPTMAHCPGLWFKSFREKRYPTSTSLKVFIGLSPVVSGLNTFDLCSLRKIRVFHHNSFIVKIFSIRSSFTGHKLMHRPHPTQPATPIFTYVLSEFMVNPVPQLFSPA